VPYTYKLHSGKTVIQYIYDSHYEGAAQAAQFAREWATLEGKHRPAPLRAGARPARYQAGHAIVWRDAIVQYFLKLSGIPDEKGRAGHYPGRLEAEDARLTGYKIIDVTPWEDASGGKAVSCEWAADSMLPSRRPHGDNSTRLTVKDVDLKPGHILRVEGTPDGPDKAALDYVEVTAAH
jgi:alpha-glucuronidase